MYEVGMSANSRVEPVFEPEVKQWEGVAPVSLGAEELIYEEEAYSGFSGLLLKSGLVILLAITAYGGYLFLSGNMTTELAEGKPGYDWAGKPIDKKERLRLTGVENQTRPVRKIDLTNTGSIDEIVTRKVKTSKITRKDVANAELHVVQSGDTLSAIGRKYKISASDIMEINAIEDARRIKPGMKLIVSR